MDFDFFLFFFCNLKTSRYLIQTFYSRNVLSTKINYDSDLALSKRIVM